jgi:hypothetical protein
MSQQELLRKVVQALDDVGVEYMLTGSIASSLQGEPRSSHDIDVVVAIEQDVARDLIKSFPPPCFYLDEESVVEAIARRDIFNLIDVTAGDKVDFWLLTDEPFDRMRFSRRRVEEVMGMHITVSTPEDTILAKLRWAKLSGGSEKQFTDALRVYEVQFGMLDIDYLHDWAKKIGVMDLLKKIETEAETIENQ